MPQAKFKPLLVLALLSSGACSDDNANDTITDATTAQVDAKVPDARIPDSEIAATIGERCTPGNRAGLIVVSGSGARRDVWATLSDKASPLYGDAFLSDASCDFHKFTPTAPCSPCSVGEICQMNGVCTPEPRPASDGKLVLRSGGEEQSFILDPMLGTTYGEITLTGAMLSMKLTGLGQTITLTELAVPDDLASVTGTITGSSSTPQAVDITWKDPQLSTSVFTHIPLNHHASGPIFTECAVGSSAEALHVDGPMLQPLAVITGLEFQGIEHVRFAAADTSIGCIEFRLQRRQFVNLVPAL
ncbi:MAG: hypothetical protein JKY56_16635 [Kofleriaceae bacterium]|nr:hypothetical protein [Kofleriaceae bacterium]